MGWCVSQGGSVFSLRNIDIVVASDHPLFGGAVAVVLGLAMIAGGYNLAQLSDRASRRAEQHPPTTTRERIAIAQARAGGRSSRLSKAIGIVFVAIGIAGIAYGLA
jgi:hypothetical protein